MDKDVEQLILLTKQMGMDELSDLPNVAAKETFNDGYYKVWWEYKENFFNSLVFEFNIYRRSVEIRLLDNYEDYFINSHGDFKAFKKFLEIDKDKLSLEVFVGFGETERRQAKGIIDDYVQRYKKMVKNN